MSKNYSNSTNSSNASNSSKNSSNASNMSNASNSSNASNASNSFSLTGYTGSKGSTSSTISTTVQEPHAGVESIYGSITLYKYWTNGNNQMQMLNGSVFALYKCKTNAAGEWIKDIEPAPVMSNISLGADGTKEINRLPYDQVFALYEKTADDGFSV